MRESYPLHVWPSTGHARSKSLEPRATDILIDLTKEVHEGRVHLVSQVASLQATALLSKSQP